MISVEFGIDCEWDFIERFEYSPVALSISLNVGHELRP